MSLGSLRLGATSWGGTSSLAAQTVALGLPTETDTALGLTVRVGATVTLGLPAETDTALGLAGGFTIGLGLPLETDTALAIIAIAAGAVITTQTWNRAGGRARSGYADLEWTPPVVTPQQGHGLPDTVPIE